jgi:hypothetical protein
VVDRLEEKIRHSTHKTDEPVIETEIVEVEVVESVEVPMDENVNEIAEELPEEPKV